MSFKCLKVYVIHILIMVLSKPRVGWGGGGRVLPRFDFCIWVCYFSKSKKCLKLYDSLHLKLVKHANF